MRITLIGLDSAKSVFQIHAVNETGKAELKRKLPRSELVHSSRSRKSARSCWRRAARPIIGPAY